LHKRQHQKREYAKYFKYGRKEAITMNLIIFGAGASYGSDTSNTPPIGNNLFNALSTFDPNKWGKLPKVYQDTLQRDFEQGVQKLSIDQSFWLPQLQRSMAAYFFNFVPRYNNLYVKMAELIGKSGWNLKGSLVTLNYERMLPIALTRNNLQPVLLPAPNVIQNNLIELCLPHGTCNFFCSAIRASGIAFSGVTFDEGAPECIIDPFQFRQRLISDSIPPIMSYFEPQKSNCSGNNFIVKMRKRYEELVLQSTKIAIIGLKVRVFDGHIWNPLSRTNAEIIYCSGRQAGTEFLNWCAQNRVGKANKVLEGYFDECFDPICKEIDLM
jgi:hypothetical protein